MSLIFDALQRSEGERSGADQSSLPAVTELLQRVEHEAVSEWRTALQTELTDTAKSTERKEEPPIATAVESPATDEVSLNDQRLNQLAHLQTLRVSIPFQSQLVSLTESEGIAAENFRFLGVRLRHMRRERPLQKVLITSTIPHEGKSMVSANLACTLARKKQQRTLLVEGDLRRPSLLQMFGIDNMPGICEWVQGESSQITNIYHLDIPHLENSGLWILPAGRCTGNPLELLQSGKLHAFTDQLATLFDWIIIDSPPILPLADTSVWSRMADGILLITRHGVTEKHQLQRGLEALDHKKVIGALLNGSQSSALSDHYYNYHPSTVSRQDNQTEE
jgi:capsular exopolysaccharide synthesis family protein